MKDTREYSFNSDALIKELRTFSEKGITELTVSDKEICSDKKKLLQFLKAVQKDCPELFVTLPLELNLVDRDVVRELLNVYASVELKLEGTEKNGALLFDRKLYSSKAALLNENGLVFGFEMSFGKQKGDTFKAFRDRLDFALSLYPNHIDFPQLEEENWDPPSTGIYSSKDLSFSHGIAFAVRTFYSAGRAVPWFNMVLQVLKVNASTFLADFEEWQQCNNCSLESGFVPENVNHTELEKMQLNFLQQKFVEKHKEEYLPAVYDLVRLNGAFSRLVQENLEAVVETSYNPDDLLSPYSMDLVRFTENVPMEGCSVKIFENDGEPDYKIL